MRRCCAPSRRRSIGNGSESCGDHRIGIISLRRAWLCLAHSRKMAQYGEFQCNLPAIAGAATRRDFCGHRRLRLRACRRVRLLRRFVPLSGQRRFLGPLHSSVEVLLRRHLIVEHPAVKFVQSSSSDSPKYLRFGRCCWSPQC